MGLLRWALLFLILALVAGVFGYTGIAVGFAEIARFLFWAFVVLLVVFLVLGGGVFRGAP